MNTDAFNERNLQKAGYAANPLEDGSLADFHVHAVALSSMTVEALKGIDGRDVARGRALEELLRARAHVVALPPARRGDARRSSRRSSRSGPRSSRRTRGPSRRAGTTARPRRTSPSRTRSRPREGRARHVPADLRQHGAHVRSRRGEQALGAPALPRRVSDHAGVGHPRAARAAQALRRADVPGGGRDRGLRSRARRGVRRRARRDDLGRAGNRAEVGDRGARGDARAAARDRRRPARRAVDRDADEARAGGLADGALRAELGVARAGRRGVDALRAASTRRSRRRASRSSTGRRCSSSRTPTSRTARSRGSSPTSRTLPDDRRPVRDGAERRRRASSRTSATTRRSRARGRSPARPASSTGSAVSRRRTRPATSPTTRRTTTAWCGCARRRSRASRPTSRSSRSTTPDGADTLVLGWGSTYGAIGAAARRVRARPAARSRRRISTTSTRSRATRARSSAATRRSSIPEINLGQLRMLIRAEFLVDAVGYNKVRGRPVPGRGARRRDHGAGGLNERRQRQPRAAHREGLQVATRRFAGARAAATTRS